VEPNTFLEKKLNATTTSSSGRARTARITPPTLRHVVSLASRRVVPLASRVGRVARLPRRMSAASHVGRVCRVASRPRRKSAASHVGRVGRVARRPRRPRRASGTSRVGRVACRPRRVSAASRVGRVASAGHGWDVLARFIDRRNAIEKNYSLFFGGEEHRIKILMPSVFLPKSRYNEGCQEVSECIRGMQSSS
jgi:hypothetical protein